MDTISRTIPIANIRPDDENDNHHPPEQIENLRHSLRTFGYVRRVVVQSPSDPNGRYTIVAGEGVYTAAQLEAFTELECTVIPATWPREKVLAYLMADNRLNRQSTISDARTAAILKQVQREENELAQAVGISDEATAAIMREAGLQPNGRPPKLPREKITPHTKPSPAAAIQESWQVELGQLWQLGDHRLICGDATDTAVVNALMRGEAVDVLLADPPYGNLKVFNARGANGNGSGRELDSRGPARVVQSVAYGEYDGHETFELPPLLEALNGRYQHAIIWGGNYFAADLPVTGSWLVWDKRANDSGPNLFYADGELAWTSLTAPLRILRYIWQGMIREGARQPRLHPTEKPVPLYEWCIGLCPDDTAVFLDPTAGSGSSLLACEQQGKRMLAAELSPTYCAVILERWSKLTNGTPELLS